MKKILIGVIAAVTILIILYFFGLFSPLNKFFSNQIPDISCKVDSDCDISRLPSNNIYCIGGKDCRMLDFNSTSIIAVNKNWRPFCPFPQPQFGGEIMCLGGTSLPSNYKEYIRCINNRCTKALP